MSRKLGLTAASAVLALTLTGPLNSDERRTRAGLLSRQVTLR